MVALICDDRFFVKQTAAGRAHIGKVKEASPYPGAKPCFVIAEERWDDADWMTALIALTAAELPPPKPKKSKKPKQPKRGQRK
jgi:TfoX/Sxy family transcriptional regulator of competence genes